MIKSLTLEQIERLVGIAIATARIKTLHIPGKKIRPALHLIICGNFGVGKSTVLEQVCEKFKIVPLMNIKRAALLGSVDKTTGLLQPPAVWTHRKGILPVDEFYFDTRGASSKQDLNALLSLMENSPFTKSIGYRCNNFEERDEDLYCIVNEKGINVKSRFMFFAVTMMPLHRPVKTQEGRAFQSRCIILPYYPTREEIFKLARSEDKINVPDYQIKKKDVVIEKEQYIRIVDYVDSFKIEEGHIFRTIGDLCRIWAVIGWDEEIFNLILILRGAFPWKQ